jgi:hypothetical protein
MTRREYDRRVYILAESLMRNGDKAIGSSRTWNESHDVEQRFAIGVARWVLKNYRRKP